MRDVVREALKNLIGVNRPHYKADRQRVAKLETMLNDYRGKYWREISVLVTALQCGVVDELFSMEAKEITQEKIDLFAQRMYIDTGIGKKYARWAIVSWIEALGLDSETKPEPVVPLVKAPAVMEASDVDISVQENIKSLESEQDEEIASQPDLTQLKLNIGPRLAIDMVWIPAGEFFMGSSEEDSMRFSSEEPQHTVMLPDFYIGKNPITTSQFAAFVRATGYKINARIDLVFMSQHPMVNINWHDAIAFCEWASQVSNRKVRLPSEAEWEKAARGTDGRIWPWGNHLPDQLVCNFNGKLRRTSMVGQYSPGGDSPYGCTDMAGNVWEWTNSMCWSYPYVLDDGREIVDVEEDRVLRGGSYNYGERFTRSAVHVGAAPNLRSSIFGFRIVTDVEVAS